MSCKWRGDKVAERVIRELICDCCGSDDRVRRWRLTKIEEGKTVSPDLCQKHSEFLEEVFKALPAGKRGQTRARRVLTEKEVKALRNK